VLTGLIAALCAAASSEPQYAHAQTGASLQFIDAGQLRDFSVASDEVFLEWHAGAPANPRAQIESLIDGATVIETVGSRALVKLSKQPDAVKLRNGTDEFSVAFPGVQVLPVIYDVAGAPGKATRRVITKYALAGLPPGQTPAQVGSLVGAISARESAQAGIAILEFPGAHHTVEALATLQKAGIPANPLLGHSWEALAVPKDRYFADQWHLLNTGQGGGLLGIDANVLDAWQLTLGAGVTISIVDSCLETGHPDLVENTPPINSGLHYDFLDQDTDPNPHLGDRHGTSMAGVAAARQNNGSLDPVSLTRLGVSGAAPEAQLIGLRIINEGGFVPVSDVEESTALFWKAGVNQAPIIDVSNNSWGPNVAGSGLIGPDILTQAALRNAVLLGRDRKGQITLFGAGNGRFGTSGSEANLNGYANSRYVIAVGAIDNLGKQASYSESGANLLISAPSSGGSLSVVTTDNQDIAGYNPPFNVLQELDNTDYTNQFFGTSSASSLVAGVAALLISANPELGWRDVKEILTSTAKQVDFADLSATAGLGWRDNRAGFKFNRKYGGGMVDASAAVIRALEWNTLSEEQVEEVRLPANQFPKTIPDSILNPLFLDFAFVGPNYPSMRVETVEVTLDIAHARRSDLEISLVSPGATPTTSILVNTASALGDNKNYQYAIFDSQGGVTKQTTGWTFTTVQHWGEDSVGTWRVIVRDRLSGQIGRVNSASIRLYGTFGSNQRFKFEKARYSVVEPENGIGAPPNTLLVNVQRLGSTAGAATVAYSTSPHGTATAAAEGVTSPDYTPLTGILTFNDGESSKQILVSVLDDTLAESTESIYLVLKNPSTGSLGGVSLATIDLLDNDENNVSIQATDPDASEPGEGIPVDRGVFTISRSVPSTQPLVVHYSITGTATPGLNPGDDYVPIETSATIPANETSTTVTIEARDDESIEGAETVILTLTARPEYKIGTPNSSVVRIIDNDRADVQIVPTANAVLTEADPTRIATVRISRTDDTSLPLTVNLTYGGNQVNGGQYQDADAPEAQSNKALPSVVIIPAGQSSLDLHIKPVNDSVYQASKQIVISLSQSADYNFNFGFLSSATLTILEDDPLPDTKIPTIKVSTPKPKTRFVLPATVTVTGSAADNTLVQAIEYRTNGGAWAPVPGVTPGKTASWSLPLNLPTHATAPEILYGANVVELRSIDNDGNRSVTGVATFNYVQEKAVEVQILGQGSVTKGFLGTTTRQVGSLYTITATPKAGQVFRRWLGLRADFPNTNSRTISFLPEDVIAPLQAEFIVSPYVTGIIGNYNGLAKEAAFSYDASGYSTVNVTASGSFSGRIFLKGVTYSFRGEFGGSGAYSGTIPRSNDLPLVVNLAIDLTPGGTQRIAGTFASPTFTLTAQLDRAPFSKANPAPASVAGKKFTLFLPSNDPDTNPDFNPDGDGYGTVTIDAAGVVRVSGTLPDGTKFTMTQALTKDVTWPFFLEPYGRKGVVIGLVTHADLTNSDFSGSSRPEQATNTSRSASKST
jgi:subtilisin-like proprotein convertase family protein